MRSLRRTLALHGGALATALGLSLTLGSGTAQAVTINPGGPFTATSSGTVTFGTSPATITCSSSVMAGNFLPSPIGSTVGTLSPTSFSGCTLGPGIPLSLTVLQPWKVNLTSVSPTNPNQFFGNVSDISLRATGVGCSIALSGISLITWTNPNSLKFTGAGTTLTVSSASCLGLVTAGSVLPFSASYTVAPSQIIT
ncbi:hypothetical protein [Streptomyces sp. NPDC008125]|uniref:hypothetical protein n=1 Tax=Streptomyces sp. NPDC008125 TaxID=3364811 RepID=UPI0036E9C78F